MSAASPAAPEQAVVEAALVLLERMGLSPAVTVAASVATAPAQKRAAARQPPPFLDTCMSMS